MVNIMKKMLKININANALVIDCIFADIEESDMERTLLEFIQQKVKEVAAQWRQAFANIAHVDKFFIATPHTKIKEMLFKKSASLGRYVKLLTVDITYL